MSPGLIHAAARIWRREPKPPVLFAFGKLPQFGDFISRNLEGAAWLARFFEALASEGRRGHEDPWFDLAQPPRRIFLRRPSLLVSRGEAMFAMVESCDRHGRRFPFAMGWYARQLEGRTCGLAVGGAKGWDFEVPTVIHPLLRAESAAHFPDTPARDLRPLGLLGWLSTPLETAATLPSDP